MSLLSPKVEKLLSVKNPTAPPFSIKLHKKQLEIWRSFNRFNVLVCGRRFGKSRMQLYQAIASAFSYEGVWDPASEPVILCAMPTLKMAKQIFFRPLVQLLKNDPRVERIDRTECLIRFHGQRPSIQVVGANDGHGDRIRGLKIYRALLDEYQAFYPDIFDEVISPAMLDTPGSKALMTGTPEGKQGSLWNAANMRDPEWSYFHAVTADNTTIYRVREKLAKERDRLDPRIYRQEYEASFEDFPGKVYSEMCDRHLIRNLPETWYRAFLGVDWGDINPALVVAVLTEGGTYVVVDSWVNSTGLPVVESTLMGEIRRLCEKWDIYRGYCDPSRPSSILEVRKQGKNNGILGMRRSVAGFNRISEGNQVVNNLFAGGRLWIHESQKEFFEELGSYRRAIAPDGTITDKIEDRQNDHRCDALRYLIASIEIKNDLSRVA